MMADLSDIPRDLSVFLSQRSHVEITVDEINRRFYFYLFDTEGGADLVLAIDATHPKGEKWLYVDGEWSPSERLKF